MLDTENSGTGYRQLTNESRHCADDTVLTLNSEPMLGFGCLRGYCRDGGNTLACVPRSTFNVSASVASNLGYQGISI